MKLCTLKHHGCLITKSVILITSNYLCQLSGLCRDRWGGQVTVTSSSSGAEPQPTVSPQQNNLLSSLLPKFDFFPKGMKSPKEQHGKTGTESD